MLLIEKKDFSLAADRRLVKASDVATVRTSEEIISAAEAEAARIREEAKAAKTDLDDGMRAWIYGSFCMKLAQAEGGFTRRSQKSFNSSASSAPTRAESPRRGPLSIAASACGSKSSKSSCAESLG